MIQLTKLMSLLSLCLLLAALQVSAQTPTPVPTKTALPQSPQDLAQLQSLMMSTDDCQLPCFWGFDPSHTSAKEVLSFVQPDEDFTNLEQYDILYYFPKEDIENAKIIILFSVKNELLTALDVILNDSSEWLPEKTFELPYFLQQMSEVPVAYLLISHGQGRIFLDLIYVESGVVIQYPFKLKVRGNVFSPTVDEPYLLCPQLKLDGAIRMWVQPEVKNLVDQFIQPSIGNRIWPVEKMTGLTTEAFIEQIVQHPTECVEMFSYPELSKLGYEF